MTYSKQPVLIQKMPMFSNMCLIFVTGNYFPNKQKHEPVPYQPKFLHGQDLKKKIIWSCCYQEKKTIINYIAGYLIHLICTRRINFTAIFNGSLFIVISKLLHYHNSWKIRDNRPVCPTLTTLLTWTMKNCSRPHNFILNILTWFWASKFPS